MDQKFDQGVKWGADGLMINGMPKEEVQRYLDSNAGKTMVAKLCNICCLLAFFISFMIVWAQRVTNVNKINDGYNQICSVDDSCIRGNFYDVNGFNGPFTDEFEA